MTSDHIPGRDGIDAVDDCPRTLEDLARLRESLSQPVRRQPHRSSSSPRVDPNATTAEALEVIRAQTREARRIANSLRRENQRYERRKAAKKKSKRIKKLIDEIKSIQAID